jgi:hypothetical protein
MTFRRAPSTRSKRRPTPALNPQFYSDALIKVPGEDTEVLVEHAEGYDGEEGEEELEVRADVPLGEYDACVDDLGVPGDGGVNVGWVELGETYQSMCIEHLAAMLCAL